MRHTKKYVYYIFVNLTQKTGLILIDLENIIIAVNYLLCLLQRDFVKNQVPILVYKDFWYQELINQSDESLLCDMTNKMQIYCMTYIFVVQDRAFTIDGYWCVG